MSNTFYQALEEICAAVCIDKECPEGDNPCPKCRVDRICAAAVEMAERLPASAYNGRFGNSARAAFDDGVRLQLIEDKAHVRKECGL